MPLNRILTIFFLFHSPYLLSAKQRDLYLDDVVPYYARSFSMGKPNSKKSTETDNSLPVPTHVRANSTPAHIETPHTDSSQHCHKRFPSCVETTTTRKETKKVSVDTFFGRITDDRQSKRAASESKEKMTKRNASSPAAISMLSVASEQKPDKSNKSLKASPELLAELLKGSSEKMSTAEREQRNKKAFYYDSIALPMAVQNFMVSEIYWKYSISGLLRKAYLSYM